MALLLRPQQVNFTGNTLHVSTLIGLPPDSGVDHYNQLAQRLAKRIKFYLFFFFPTHAKVSQSGQAPLPLSLRRAQLGRM